LSCSLWEIADRFLFMSTSEEYKEIFLIQRANFDRFRKLYRKRIDGLEEDPTEITQEIDVRFTLGGLKQRHHMRVPENKNLNFMEHKDSCDLYVGHRSNGWEYKYWPSPRNLVDEYSYLLFENSPLLRDALENYGGFWKVYVDAHYAASGSSYADMSPPEVQGVKWQSFSYNFDYLVPGFSTWLINDYLSANFEIKRTRTWDLQSLDGSYQGRHIEEQEVEHFLVLNELERMIAQELMAFVETCRHPEPVKCELCGELDVPDMSLNLGFNLPDTFCQFCSTIVGYSYPHPSFLEFGIPIETRKKSQIEAFKSFLKLVDIPYWKSPLINRDHIFHLNLREESKVRRKKIAHILSSVPKRENFYDVFESPRHFLHEAGLESLIPPDRSRGTKSISRCGHLCLSQGEREICEYLYKTQIKHSREPMYAELTNSSDVFGQMRGDFLVGDLVIEFAGLDGDPDYDSKIRLKIQLASQEGIELLVLYPTDLKALSKKLGKLSKRKK
jgi:hypothetical protein